MRILGGRNSFYQWDINQRITSERFKAGDEIHFSTRVQSNAFVVVAYEHEGKVVADVPNILLQEHFSILAYRYTREGEGSQTIESRKFEVVERAKPDGYVYTETEIQCFVALDKRITELEKGPKIEVDTTLSIAGMAADAKAVGDALADIPEFTEDDALTMLFETGTVKPLADASGTIYTDKNGAIYSF